MNRIVFIERIDLLEREAMGLCMKWNFYPIMDWVFLWWLNFSSMKAQIRKKDIRDLAIDASIKWESIHDEGLKSYLYGYNYYGYQSNILSSNNGYKVIANETLKNTDVGTNKYLNYVGININKVDNKYYFIIIYE